MEIEYSIQIEEPTVLHEYGSVPISFRVTSEYKISMLNQGLGGVHIEEVPVKPYWVDYDAERGRGPERWLDRWDIRNWSVISAFHKDERIGGAVVAFDTPGVHMLDGRSDVAALWDIRIRPDHRKGGLGTAIFQECITLARTKKSRFFKIETHSYNIPACKFYAKQGALLGNIEKMVYEENPHHYRMIWWVDME